MLNSQGLPFDRDFVREYRGYLILPKGDDKYVCCDRVDGGWSISVFDFDTIAEAERFLDMSRDEMNAWFAAGCPSLVDDSHSRWLAEHRDQ